MQCDWLQGSTGLCLNCLNSGISVCPLKWIILFFKDVTLLLSWYPIKCSANTIAAEVWVFVRKEYGKLSARNVFPYTKVPKLVPEKRTIFAHVVQSNRLRLSLGALLVKACSTFLCLPQEGEAQQGFRGRTRQGMGGEQALHDLHCSNPFLQDPMAAEVLFGIFGGYA